MQFGTSDDRVLPTSTEVRQVGDAMRDDFGGGDVNALAVITETGVAASPLADYARDLSRVEHVTQVDSSAGTFLHGELTASTPADARFARPDAQRLTVLADLDRNSSAARDLVDRVRDVPGPGCGAAFACRTAVFARFDEVGRGRWQRSQSRLWLRPWC
ncbi:hypothetical protein ACIBG0_38695 [Nocardia sp. NPDC050630]|uniref:hypothetical protein n=1 Tax=Nocardia sp. NPDC050630 TaxID=3364321 RepID=UPI0037B9EE64